MIAMVMDGEAIMIMVVALIEGETEALLTGTVISANVDATTTRRAFTRLPTTITTVMDLAPTNKVMRMGCVLARVMHGRARVTSLSARIFTSTARADSWQCSAVVLRMLRLIAMVFYAVTKRVIRTTRLTSSVGNFGGRRLLIQTIFNHE